MAVLPDVRDKCIGEQDARACVVLGRLLDNDVDFTGLNLDSTPPAPPTLPAPDVCWAPGAAVVEAGVSGLPSLTVQQAVNVYAAVARGLRHDALLHADLHQFARREVDLNMDGALSRYEVLFGLARLVRPEVWNEKLLEQLWRWEPTVA